MRRDACNKRPKRKQINSKYPRPQVKHRQSLDIGTGRPPLHNGHPSHVFSTSPSIHADAPDLVTPDNPFPNPQTQQPSAEFDHAINYVTTIKKQFASAPDTHTKFLEILYSYQKEEQRDIKEVIDEVSVLFADHPDLLKGFTYFLPDAVQEEAKLQLQEAVWAAELKKV